MSRLVFGKDGRIDPERRPQCKIFGAVGLVQTFIRQADKIYQLTYEDGTLVETTWSHPFYIVGKGWVNAEDMAAGDVSETSDGGSLTIAKVDEEGQKRGAATGLLSEL